MRYIYTLLFYLAIPWIALRLYLKGRRLPAYRQRIKERFLLDPSRLTTVDVWVHAVSLGEAVAVTPLVEALLAKQQRVLVTTLTPTGSAQVMKHFGARVSHHYLPYDFPWVVRRFFKIIRPRVGIIMETELWPNLIHQAKILTIPLMIVNGRLSEKAFKQYFKARYFFKPILNELSAILTQSELDKQRFIALGTHSQNVRVIGNMKFDLQTTIPQHEIYQQLKTACGTTRLILIAASTHEGEEALLLDRWAVLSAAIPGLLLLIAPRHPERFKAVYTLCQQRGLNARLRSEPSTLDVDADVVVLDSLGELLGFYSISDYAFVGGSLVPIGGHNVLEPIAVHVPVFCGPFMQNSKAICSELCEANAMQMLPDADALVAAVIAMYNNPKQRQQQIENASAVLIVNQGTVARYLNEVLH